MLDADDPGQHETERLCEERADGRHDTSIFMWHDGDENEGGEDDHENVDEKLNLYCW